MGKYIAVILLILASAVGGGLYAIQSIKTASTSQTFIHNGVWYTDKTFGDASANAKTRAYVAVVGLLALPRKETIYYLSRQTESGEALQSTGIYELRGKDLPSRWWSLTLYDEDHFLTPNPHGTYSVRGTDIDREADGSFRIVLAREPQDGNWIPMGEGKNMTLLLRLYNPEPDLENRLTTVKLPTLKKIGEMQ